ncbi:MAG: zinc ribbon domain-containing protein [Candidatus Odinarchaeota archaeon]
MHQRNSVAGIVICMISFVLFGLFFAFRPFIGFSFFPMFPAIFIFIFIIIAAATSVENSKKTQRNYYNNQNYSQVPLKNPYIIQNKREIEIQEETREVIRAQYCQYCGIKIDPDANYCHNCGTSRSE